MTRNQSRLHHLHYQITPEDYAALRGCLSDRVEERETRSVYMMFFANYRDRIPMSLMGELLAVDRAPPRFSLQYYDDDPTYLLLVRWLEGERTSAMVTEAECRALLTGETDWLLKRQNPLLLDFHEGLTERMLLPHMSVTCRREIYTANHMGLSVALHTDIRTTLEHMDFLDPRQFERDTADQDDRILMEVSYSDHIPDDVLYLLKQNAPRRKLLRR